MVVAVVGPPQSGGTDDRQGPLLLVDGMARASLRPSGEGLGGGRCGVMCSAERCNTSTAWRVWCKGSEFWKGCQGVGGVFFIFFLLY